MINVSHKGFAFRIFNKLLQLNSNDKNSTITEEDIQMANNHMKWHSQSVTNRETQIKTSEMQIQTSERTLHTP